MLSDIRCSQRTIFLVAVVQLKRLEDASTLLSADWKDDSQSAI